jgi:WD40 repeat protein
LLRLSGVVKPDGERRLEVRNRIYGQVFNERWVREATPVDMRLIVGVAAALVLLAVLSVSYLAIFPGPYVQELEAASRDVQVAYNGYDALHRLHRGQSEDLLAQFFERRGDRDEAIMMRAKEGDGAKLAALVGPDYPLLKRTFRHGGAVHAVSFSPDGKLIATGSEDNIARVFEAATGHEVSRLVHGSGVYAVAFSPDGRLVATGSGDMTARVFEAATGHEVSRLVHGSGVYAVAFSPDGKLVATGSYDNSARVFEAATGHEVSRLVHRSWVRAVTFSPDGKQVATAATDDGTARVFAAATGHEVSRLVHVRGVAPYVVAAFVYAVAFSPDGKLVATGSEGGTARVFEVATGREVSRLPQGTVDAVVFSPDGKLVATGSEDGTARVFEAATGREISGLAHQGTVQKVAFSPDSKLVATGSGDRTARVFEAATGRELSRLAHQSWVYAVAFSPDGRLVATGSDDMTARVFEAATGRELSRPALQDTVHATSVLNARAEQTRERILSPTGSYSITQTGDWLHLYQRSGKDNWRPIANRFLPVIIPNTVRFLPSSADCPRCVEVLRDVPENRLKLDCINFDKYPPPIQADPKNLVGEWSAKLGLTFDARGHVVPIQP